MTFRMHVFESIKIDTRSLPFVSKTDECTLYNSLSNYTVEKLGRVSREHFELPLNSIVLEQSLSFYIH